MRNNTEIPPTTSNADPLSMEPEGAPAPLMLLAPETPLPFTIASPKLRKVEGDAEGAAASAGLSSAGSILTGIGAHAVSAGTSSNAATVTSHTRWRAPADARCIERVIPRATRRMIVALKRSIIMETLPPKPARLEKIVDMAIISRSGERGEWCCAVA